MIRIFANSGMYITADDLKVFTVFIKMDGCYDIKPVRKEDRKSYWKIPLCDDDATREK